MAEDLSVRAVEESVRDHENEPDDGVPPSTVPSPAKGLRPAGLLELEELLSAHLDTRVNVTMGAKRGRVVIDFATVEDLERIYRAMTDGPQRDD